MYIFNIFVFLVYYFLMAHFFAHANALRGLLPTKQMAYFPYWVIFLDKLKISKLSNKLLLILKGNFCLNLMKKIIYNLN